MRGSSSVGRQRPAKVNGASSAMPNHTSLFEPAFPVHSQKEVTGTRQRRSGRVEHGPPERGGEIAHVGDGPGDLRRRGHAPGHPLQRERAVDLPQDRSLTIRVDGVVGGQVGAVVPQRPERSPELVHARAHSVEIADRLSSPAEWVIGRSAASASAERARAPVSSGSGPAASAPPPPADDATVLMPSEGGSSVLRAAQRRSDPADCRTLVSEATSA